MLLYIIIQYICCFLFSIPSYCKLRRNEIKLVLKFKAPDFARRSLGFLNLKLIRSIDFPTNTLLNVSISFFDHHVTTTIRSFFHFVI